MTADILILSNGPGELTTWVLPSVKALRQQLGRNQVRISVVLSPCPNSSGKEATIARSFPEVDRVQAAEHFWQFLLWGRTFDSWDWHKAGVVVFLGGDQFFTVVIGKRLGYRTVVYAEWEARWHSLIDRFGVMKPEVAVRVPQKYAHKFTVVGDLMAEAQQEDTGTRGHGDTGKEEDTGTRGHGDTGKEEDTGTRGHGDTGKEEDTGTRGHGDTGKEEDTGTRGHGDTGKEEDTGTRGHGDTGKEEDTGTRGHGDTGTVEELSASPRLPFSASSSHSLIELIGVLPGSKAAKLSQGVPLMLAIAEYVYAKRPQTKFVIPVAPTLDLLTVASFADPQKNPFVQTFGFSGAFVSAINTDLAPPVLKTATGLCVELWNQTPAYDLLSQCCLCLTTVGANTAELGALAVPMIVLLPTQQLDAMRSWDGLPGLLANLPLVGSGFAKVINWLALKRLGLLAWPNIWAQEMVVPELVGKLQPQQVGEMVLDFLNYPEKLENMRAKLRSIRGEPGAAQKLATLVKEELEKL